ncbi:MAG: UPF0149 family protein [Xanthomonadales bacterium]|nr:UPF0149 family protein [Xanthomonadales bacterium]
MNLPDFELCLAQVGSDISPFELSALHGSICGLLCAKPNLGLMELTAILPKMGQAAVLESAIVDQLADILMASRLQLEDEDMSLVVWLPDDETKLAIRTACLADWCSGVLAGLSELAGEALSKIYAESRNEDSDNMDAAEALRDFTSIARIVDEPIDGSDDNEDDFIQISEYCRVALLLFHEMLRGPDELDSIH